MARKTRPWYPGAVYHIMARGNHQQDIVGDESDFEVLLEMLKRTSLRYGTSIHSFCLMTNHYHLLIETTDEPVWKIMKQLNQHYAEYFNSKHQCVGHSFQDRYRSALVKDTPYFLSASRYIHLNPVKARMVDYPQAYRWSSYGSFVGTDRLNFVVTDKVLGCFQDPQVLRYRDFVEGELLATNREFAQSNVHFGDEAEWLPW